MSTPKIVVPVVLCIVSIASMALGAATTQPAASEAAATGDELIQLNLPKHMAVADLVDYVSRRLRVNILCGEELGRKKVTITSPAGIPKGSLMGLLQSVLRMSGLMMVDAEQSGWKKIVANKDLLAVSGEVNHDASRLADAAAMAPVTQVSRFGTLIWTTLGRRFGRS